MTIQEIKAKFERDYTRLRQDFPDNALERHKQQFELCTEAIRKLKNTFLHEEFNSAEDQIHFFKEVKPFIESRLLYCNDAIEFELSFPNESEYLSKFCF